MASPSAGPGLVFNSTASVAGVVTSPMDSKQFFMGSYQTKTDGTQTLTVDVQVSNVPAMRDGYTLPAGVAVRDDSYASTDWVTVSTNAMTAVAQSRMDVVAYLPHKVSRLRLTSGAGTPSVKVWYQLQGNS